jgi:hypothetical protein
MKYSNFKTWTITLLATMFLCQRWHAQRMIENESRIDERRFDKMTEKFVEQFWQRLWRGNVDLVRSTKIYQKISNVGRANFSDKFLVKFDRSGKRFPNGRLQAVEKVNFVVGGFREIDLRGCNRCRTCFVWSGFLYESIFEDFCWAAVKIFS